MILVLRFERSPAVRNTKSRFLKRLHEVSNQLIKSDYAFLSIAERREVLRAALLAWKRPFLAPLAIAD